MDLLRRGGLEPGHIPAGQGCKTYKTNDFQVFQMRKENARNALSQ